MKKTFLLASLALQASLSLAQGTSVRGGGYKDMNSKRVLIDAQTQALDSLRSVDAAVVSKLGADRLQLMELIATLRPEPKIKRSRDERELMFDYGEDEKGKYIVALAGFYDAYAYVSPDLEPSVLQNVEQKIIHEAAHLFNIGIKDDSLAESFATQLTSQMGQEASHRHQESQENNVPSINGSTALFTYQPDLKKNADDGISLEDALRYCDQFQQLYYKKYFMVYCSLKARALDVLHYDLKSDPTHEIIGYHVERNERGTELSQVIKSHHAKGSGDFTERDDPIVIDHPHMAKVPDEIIHKKVYGLMIFGFGLMAELPWKVLYPDAEIEEEAPVESSVGAAKLDCLRILDERKKNPTFGLEYERAECFKEKVSAGYSFKIKTRNPFL